VLQRASSRESSRERVRAREFEREAIIQIVEEWRITFQVRDGLQTLHRRLVPKTQSSERSIHSSRTKTYLFVRRLPNGSDNTFKRQRQHNIESEKGSFRTTVREHGDTHKKGRLDNVDHSSFLSFPLPPPLASDKFPELFEK
jgi:hypothetical protein